jgi:hypothetical protein
MKFLTCLSLIALAALVSCGGEEGKPSGVEIRQFATYVIGQSTEYNPTGNWSAERALGEPDVYPIHGDKVLAWASKTTDDQREYIILGFDTLQSVRAVEIYETYNPGAIDTVYLRNASTMQWVKVYSRSFQILPLQSRKFTFFLNNTEFKVDAIRIALNSPEVPGWNEIDAVAIHGYRNKVAGE